MTAASSGQLSPRAQRRVVFVIALGLFLAFGLYPFGDRSAREAVAGTAVTCNNTPTALSGLVNGPTLSLGTGSVTPCIAHAPIHMRIGYTNGDNGSSVGGLTTQFTSDGISFPNGRYERPNTGCFGGVRSDSTIAKPTILRFADGTQSAGPSNVTVYNSGVLCPSTNLYAQRGWNTAFAKDDNAMLVQMRFKGLDISRNAYMTVVPQSAPAAPTAAGTGEYKLTFTPSNQSGANWTIGSSDQSTDLWLRADTHIKVNIFGINTSVGQLAGDSSLWGSILGTIASFDNIPGLEMDGWVYFLATSGGNSSSVSIKLPSTKVCAHTSGVTCP